MRFALRARLCSRVGLPTRCSICSDVPTDTTDLVKCRRQADKSIYKGNMDGWSKIWRTEGGIRGIYTGWGPTLLGYSVQGSFKVRRA